MKELSDNLQEAKNLLEQTTPWITLLDISLLEGGTIRYTDNGEDVTFSGNIYEAFPFKADPIKSDDSGKVPTISISVSNISKVLMPYLETSGGLVGAEVTLYAVNTGNLSEDYADLTMNFTVMSASADEEWVTLGLGAPSPLRKKFPPDRYLATACAWEFRSIECGYTGSDTICNRTYAECVNKENDARFGGFYGLSPDGFKVIY